MYLKVAQVDTDIQPAAPTTFTDSSASPDSPVTPVGRVSVTAAKQAISGTDSVKKSGDKPTAPPKDQIPITHLPP
ncbi:hypothetical protein EVAR_46780_1 [Eumeta japonica]|uniref:Uncharacterized protein n=1 Tax=Eumeta variegata TaxID=151549 RepID=A0A4C1XFQ3_EUMVA|nr:hypothetical protein EVAR_46780_1 [Eumeta japonica]